MTAEDLEISTLFGSHRPPLQWFRSVLVFCRPYGAVFCTAPRPHGSRRGLKLYRSLRELFSRVAASEDPHAVRRGPQFIARFARGFSRVAASEDPHACPPSAPVLSLASRAGSAA